MPTILTLLFFAIRTLFGRLVGWRPQPIKLRVGGDPRSRAHAYLYPDGRLLAGVGGGDGTEDDDDDDSDDDDEDDVDPDDDDDDDDDLEDVDDWDRERAANTIRSQRKERKKLEKERKAAEKRAKTAEDRLAEIDQENESEKERAEREARDARDERDGERKRADRLQVNEAIREACAEKDVPAKKVKRVLKLIDRDEIEIDDGEVEGVEDALDELLVEIPELLGKAVDPPPDDDEEDEPVTKTSPGANPDRRRKPKPMTAEKAAKLAKENPAKFNELFDAGKIPASALGGK